MSETFREFLVTRTSLMNKGFFSWENMQQYRNIKFCSFYKSDIIKIINNATETTPHAPTNVTVVPGVFSATVSWMSAFDGGHPQTYDLWWASSWKWFRSFINVYIKSFVHSFLIYAIEAISICYTKEKPKSYWNMCSLLDTLLNIKYLVFLFYFYFWINVRLRILMYLN